MGLRILKNADGSFRPAWYGRICVDGKARETKLDVDIKGTIPLDESGNVRLSQEGDEAFERSRKAAEKALEKWRKETKTSPAELQEKAYKARTGEDLGGVPLNRLFEAWRDLKRETAPADGWQSTAKKRFDDFAAFARKHAAKGNGRCETINDITPEIAAAWFDHIKGQFAWETVRKMMTLMRGAYRRFATGNRRNPFEDIITRGGGKGGTKTISREALTNDQLTRLFDISRDDPLHPLIVCAACTGMRIGDVCNLKWCDVDLKAGLIDVATAKTGARVTIPIFDRLREVLEECAALPADGADASPFVFPRAAWKYNPRTKLGDDFKPLKDKDGKPIMTDARDSIVKGVKPLIARAVFGEAKEPEPVAVDADGNATEPRPIEDALADCGYVETKKARLREVYALAKLGMRNLDIANKIGVARSIVSEDLRDLSKLTGENLRPIAGNTHRVTRRDLIEKTRVERTDGKGKRTCKRAASAYGWHSFRHSFVILALNAGVPVENVRKITGHGETETTINFYFNPSKAHEAERVKAQMAGTALAGGTAKRKAVRNAPQPPAVTAAPSIDDLISGMSEAQRKALAARLLGL